MRSLKGWTALFAAALLLALQADASINTYDFAGRIIYGGLQVGTKSTVGTAANLMTRSLGASATIDFATATITCNDSSAISVPGAQVNDPCFVGPPAAPTANTSYTCFVSSADNVKVRYCAAGTAADPASAIFFVRVLSSQ